MGNSIILISRGFSCRNSILFQLIFHQRKKGYLSYRCKEDTALFRTPVDYRNACSVPRFEPQIIRVALLYGIAFRVTYVLGFLDITDYYTTKFFMVIDLGE
jgi:hypothetical protein